MMFPPKEPSVNNGEHHERQVPPQLPHTRHRRRFCFLKLVLTSIITSIVLVAFFWFALTSQKIKVSVVAAELREFYLSNGTTLHFNLTLNLVVRNPNKKVSIFYDKLEGIAAYEGKRFTWATTAPFYQGRKNTTYLTANFSGEQVMEFDQSRMTNFKEEERKGLFGIDVRFNLQARFKMGGLKTEFLKPDVKCHLSVPLASNSTVSATFEKTWCKVDI